MKSVFQSFFKLKEEPVAEEFAPSLSEEQEPEKIAPGITKVALQGDIALIAIDDIFQLIDHASLTGELEIHSDVDSGSFFFSKGMLVFGMLETNQKMIGEILINERLITAEQLDECLVLHEKSERQQRLGSVLIEQGYLHQDNLTASLGRQIKEAFFEVLGWTEGRFLFHSNQEPGKERVLIRERIDHLLLEGMIYIDDNNAS